MILQQIDMYCTNIYANILGKCANRDFQDGDSPHKQTNRQRHMAQAAEINTEIGLGVGGMVWYGISLDGIFGECGRRTTDDRH